MHHTGIVMKHSAVVAHTITPILGASTGLRTFTPLAVTAWFALAGKLRVKRTWAHWIGHPAAVGLLTTAAIGEYVGDTLPDTPNRTSPPAPAGPVSVRRTRRRHHSHRRAPPTCRRHRTGRARRGCGHLWRLPRPAGLDPKTPAYLTCRWPSAETPRRWLWRSARCNS